MNRVRQGEVYLGVVAEGVLRIDREEVESLGTTFPKPLSIAVWYPHLKPCERLLLEGAQVQLRTLPRSRRGARLRARRIRRSMLKRNHKRGQALFRSFMRRGLSLDE